MKHATTIIFDDETRETELVIGDKRYLMAHPHLEIRREPIRDLDAEAKDGCGYQILKPGPLMELTFRGTITSESDA